MAAQRSTLLWTIRPHSVEVQEQLSVVAALPVAEDAAAQAVVVDVAVPALRLLVQELPAQRWVRHLEGLVAVVAVREAPPHFLALQLLP